MEKGEYNIINFKIHYIIQGNKNDKKRIVRVVQFNTI